MDMQKRWVDDMLDLYNVAKQLGDDPWAHNIMEALEAGYEASEQNEETRKQTLLEKRLFEIDTRLNELRKNFEQAESVKSRQQLYEQAIKLQIERAQIEDERKRHLNSINSS